MYEIETKQHQITPYDNTIGQNATNTHQITPYNKPTTLHKTIKITSHKNHTAPHHITPHHKTRQQPYTLKHKEGICQVMGLWKPGQLQYRIQKWSSKTQARSSAWKPWKYPPPCPTSSKPTPKYKGPARRRKDQARAKVFRAKQLQNHLYHHFSAVTS